MPKFQDDIFQQHPVTTTPSSPFSDHLIWARNAGIFNAAPLCHGVQHAARTAIWTELVYHLYFSSVFPSIFSRLNERDLELVKLAALFHDTGREDDDGQDKTDEISALNAERYMRVVGYPNKEIGLVCNIIENKESIGNDPFGYYNIKETFMTALLHHADCLDIIRARSMFDLRYLKLFLRRDTVEVSTPLSTYGQNAMIMDFLQRIVMNIRSLIFDQGDQFYNLDETIKKRYVESPDPFQEVENDLTRYPLLEKFYRSIDVKFINNREQWGSLFNHNNQRILSEVGMDSAAAALVTELNHELMTEGVYTRGIRRPGNLASRTPRLSQAECELSFYTQADSKNPGRSITLQSYGTPPFSHTALVLRVETKKIREVFEHDSDTGHGISRLLLAASKKKKDAIQNLKIQMIEGSAKKNVHSPFAYPEIIISIRKRALRALQFCQEITLAQHEIVTSSKERREAIVELEFIHTVFTARKLGLDLPLCVYSYARNLFTPYIFPEQEKIKALWREILTEINIVDENQYEYYRNLCLYYPEPFKTEIEGQINQSLLKQAQDFAETFLESKSDILTHKTKKFCILWFDKLDQNTQGKIQKEFLNQIARITHTTNYTISQIIELGKIFFTTEDFLPHFLGILRKTRFFEFKIDLDTLKLIEMQFIQNNPRKNEIIAQFQAALSDYNFKLDITEHYHSSYFASHLYLLNILYVNPKCYPETIQADLQKFIQKTLDQLNSYLEEEEVSSTGGFALQTYSRLLRYQLLDEEQMQSSREKLLAKLRGNQASELIKSKPSAFVMISRIKDIPDDICLAIAIALNRATIDLLKNRFEAYELIRDYIENDFKPEHKRELIPSFKALLTGQPVNFTDRPFFDKWLFLINTWLNFFGRELLPELIRMIPHLTINLDGLQYIFTQSRDLQEALEQTQPFPEFYRALFSNSSVVTCLKPKLRKLLEDKELTLSRKCIFYPLTQETPTVSLVASEATAEPEPISATRRDQKEPERIAEQKEPEPIPAQAKPTLFSTTHRAQEKSEPIADEEEPKPIPRRT